MAYTNYQTWKGLFVPWTSLSFSIVCAVLSLLILAVATNFAAPVLGIYLLAAALGFVAGILLHGAVRLVKFLFLSSAIRGLVVDNKITIKQALRLTPKDKELLGIKIIGESLAKDDITLAQISSIPPYLHESLKNEKFCELIGNEKIDDVLSAKEHQVVTLKSIPIHILIVGGHIKLEEALRLSLGGRLMLEGNIAVRDCLIYGRASLNKVLTLTRDERMFFRREKVRKLLSDNTITFEEARQLAVPGCEGIARLEEGFIENLLKGNKITVEQISSLTFKQYKAFEDNYFLRLIDANVITVDEVLQLSDAQVAVLRDKAIQALLDANVITVDEVLQLSDAQVAVLRDKVIQDLLLNKIVNIEDVLQLLFPPAWFQQTALREDCTRRLLAANKITLSKFLSLSFNQARILADINFCLLIEHNLIAIDQIPELTDDQCRNFLGSAIGMVAFIFRTGGTIVTVEDMLQLPPLTPAELDILNDKSIISLIRSGALTIEQAVTLPINHFNYLKEQVIFNLVVSGRITFASFLRLREGMLEALSSNRAFALGLVNSREEIENIIAHQDSIPIYIYYLIAANVITIGQALHLSDTQVAVLQTKGIRDLLIIDKIVKIEDVLQLHLPLTSLQKSLLQQNNIRALIVTNEITLSKFLSLSSNQAQVLGNKGVLPLIKHNLIAIDRISGLTDDQCENLLQLEVTMAILETACLVTVEDVLQLPRLTHEQLEIVADWNILALMRIGVLKIAQAVMLPFSYLGYLDRIEIFELIVSGKVTFNAFLRLSEDSINRLLSDDAFRLSVITGETDIEGIIASQDINNAQSTHTASVHKSVSESAIRLYKRYVLDRNENLEAVIPDIARYVHGLPDNERYKTAKQCFDGITAPNFDYRDRVSGLTIIQVLALSYLSINDDSTREGLLEDAQERFIDGLCEIENGDHNRPICPSGTFNKIIEKLKSIDPDVEIDYVTRQMAAIELVKVVRQQASMYLYKKLALANSDNKLKLFKELISNLKDKNNGVTAIWEDIKPKVSDRMFGEFGCLYDGKESIEFTSLVDCGEYAPLIDLDQLAEKAEAKAKEAKEKEEEKAKEKANLIAANESSAEGGVYFLRHASGQSDAAGSMAEDVVAHSKNDSYYPKLYA